MMRKRITAVGLGLAAFVVVAYAAGAASKLYINNSVASSGVKVIDGKAYVPIADVAKALDMVVKKRGDGYEMVKDGGAGQIANDNVGKIGQEVFTGKWKFQVLDVKTVKSFTKEYSGDNYDKQFNVEGRDDIVVVKCRVKNGTKKKDELVFANWDGMNTALTDDREQSFQPTAYDVRESEHSPVGTTFLPGAAIEFNIIFIVPKGTKPGDLIFTAMRYDDRAGFDQKKRPPTDIRVKLSK